MINMFKNIVADRNIPVDEEASLRSGTHFTSKSFQDLDNQV